MSNRLLAVVGAVVVVVVIVLGVFVTSQGVISDGNKKQQDLITSYNDTTNVLSDCLVKTKQSVGAAGAQTNALDKVIKNAVRGRYGKNSSAQPGNGALFSAIKEAYPDVSGLSKRFDDVMVVINGCRSDFRDSQAQLQRQVTLFNQWRTGSWKVRTFGGDDYPTSDMTIKVGNGYLSGKTALVKMRELVVVSDAQNGRDTGNIDNDDPFSSK